MMNRWEAWRLLFICISAARRPTPPPPTQFGVSGRGAGLLNRENRQQPPTRSKNQWFPVRLEAEDRHHKVYPPFIELHRSSVIISISSKLSATTSPCRNGS